MKYLNLLLELNITNLEDIQQYLKPFIEKTASPIAQAWLGKQIRKHLINDETNAIEISELPASSPEWMKAAHEKGEKLYRSQPTPEFSENLDHIIDWLNSLNTKLASQDNQEKVEAERSLASLPKVTFPQAIEHANKWTQALIRAGSKAMAGEGEDIIYEFADGYYFVNLTAEEACAAEGNRMGHCVGSYFYKIKDGSIKIYSLRDPKNEPHATLEHKQGEVISDGITFNGTMTQIKGKKNEPPIEKYVPHVKEFLNWLKAKGNSRDIQKMGLFFGGKTGKYGTLYEVNEPYLTIKNYDLYKESDYSTEKIHFLQKETKEKPIFFIILSTGSWSSTRAVNSFDFLSADNPTEEQLLIIVKFLNFNDDDNVQIIPNNNNEKIQFFEQIFFNSKNKIWGELKNLPKIIDSDNFKWMAGEDFNTTMSRRNSTITHKTSFLMDSSGKLAASIIIKVSFKVSKKDDMVINSSVNITPHLQNLINFKEIHTSTFTIEAKEELALYGLAWSRKNTEWVNIDSAKPFWVGHLGKIIKLGKSTLSILDLINRPLGICHLNAAKLIEYKVTNTNEETYKKFGNIVSEFTHSTVFDDNYSLSSVFVDQALKDLNFYFNITTEKLVNVEAMYKRESLLKIGNFDVINNFDIDINLEIYDIIDSKNNIKLRIQKNPIKFMTEANEIIAGNELTMQQKIFFVEMLNNSQFSELLKDFNSMSLMNIGIYKVGGQYIPITRSNVQKDVVKVMQGKIKVSPELTFIRYKEGENLRLQHSPFLIKHSWQLFNDADIKDSDRHKKALVYILMNSYGTAIEKIQFRQEKISQDDAWKYAEILINMLNKVY